MARDVKKRNWAAVIWPDSLPENWQQILQQTNLPCVVSPLHCLDVDELTGEVKKAHYHVIMCWDGPATFAMAKRITDQLQAPIPQPIENVRSAYRYLTHKDNPEKYQYDEKDIITFNGFNAADYIDLTKSEVRRIRAEIQSLIREQDIWEYADLCDYLLDNDMLDHYDWACSNTFFTCEYIKSNWRRSQKGIDNSAQ